MDLERTALPGIGVAHLLHTEGGQRLGVVSHLSGQRDLVMYDEADPDTVRHTVTLGRTESQTVADLLEGTITLDHVTELEQSLAGVHAVRIRIRADSPYIDRPLGDTQARTRTGASIVAVVRDGHVLPSPGPDFIFQVGDSLLAVGDEPGTRALKQLLTSG